MKKIFSLLLYILPFIGYAQVGIYPQATATGTNTYSASVSGLTSLQNKQRFEIKFENGNSGASTLDPDGAGSITAKPIVKNGSAALSGGEISANQILYLVYDGTNFQIIGGAGEELTSQDITDALGFTPANNSTLSSHVSNTSNPHSVTKSQVGLSNVDNTADNNKPEIKINGADNVESFRIEDNDDNLIMSAGEQDDAAYIRLNSGYLIFLSPNDVTAMGRFDFSNISAETTHTYYWPDADGTVYLEGSPTFDYSWIQNPPDLSTYMPKVGTLLTSNFELLGGGTRGVLLGSTVSKLNGLEANIAGAFSILAGAASTIGTSISSLTLTSGSGWSFRDAISRSFDIFNSGDGTHFTHSNSIGSHEGYFFSLKGNGGFEVSGTGISFKVNNADGIAISRTVTASGTTGAQIINNPSGTVNFAAGAQTIVVTNSFSTTTTQYILTIQNDDTTAKSAVVSNKASGSFTIKLNATATAETTVYFELRN